MVNQPKNSQNRRIHRTVNPYEVDQSNRPNTLGGLAKDVGRGVAGAFGDMANDAYTDFFGGSPTPPTRRRHPVSQPTEPNQSRNNLTILMIFLPNHKTKVVSESLLLRNIVVNRRPKQTIF
ncbi:MAG: hypothetical protein U0525_05425 [Patescibacteria group bacterium]